MGRLPPKYEQIYEEDYECIYACAYEYMDAYMHVHICGPDPPNKKKTGNYTFRASILSAQVVRTGLCWALLFEQQPGASIHWYETPGASIHWF